MNNPKVSIVVPVCNVEQYLKECLESIINQTLQEIEIICIDDGSTDSSPQILDDYAQKDSRVKVVHKPNAGYGHTMNFGMSLAQGDYIGIVESDDWVKPDMYAALYDIAVRENLDFIRSDFYRFTHGKNGELKLTYEKVVGEESYYNRIIRSNKKQPLFRFNNNTWNGIYKTEFIKSNGITHNETPGASYQDNGFWFKTLVLAERFMICDRPFYMNRRDNPNSSVLNTGKVDAIKKEYDLIGQWLFQREDKDDYIYVYNYKRFQNYLWTIDRVDIKYWLKFMTDFADEYNREKSESKVDESLFNDGQMKTIRRIAADPEGYCQIVISDIESAKESLRSYSSIIIYGSGSYGRRVVNTLAKLRMLNMVECFAVTEKGEKVSDEILGIPVCSIDEIEADRAKALMVVAVKPKSDNERAIKENLSRLGYKNIWAADEFMEKVKWRG